MSICEHAKSSVRYAHGEANTQEKHIGNVSMSYGGGREAFLSVSLSFFLSFFLGGVEGVKDDGNDQDEGYQAALFPTKYVASWTGD